MGNLGRRTLGFTCCRKPERRRSGRWRLSGAVLGSASFSEGHCLPRDLRAHILIHSPVDEAFLHEVLWAYLPRFAGPRMHRLLAVDPTPISPGHAIRAHRGHRIDATSSERTNWRHAPTNSAG